MTTEAITSRSATAAGTAPGGVVSATSRIGDEPFATLLHQATDRPDEPADAPAPPVTASTPAPVQPSIPASPPPMVVGAPTPGTIGALLAVAAGSGADMVAGTIAQLIGSAPGVSLPVPMPTGPATTPTDVVLGGDMDQRRAALEPLFAEAGARYGIDPALLAAVAWTESAFQPDVVSHAGAIGLMQIMPGTAAELGVDPRDPAQAIDGAARYLRDALDRFGDVRLALAAYNAGPGAVASHGGIPPYPETTAYVVTVMDRYESLRGAST